MPKKKRKILTGDIGWSIRSKDFMGEDSVAISSYGGSLYDGLTMADVVTAGGIEVQAYGVVASAATLPLVVSPRKTGTPNSRYLIHDPWSDAVGNSLKIQKAADELEKERILALDLYEKHLKIPREEIETLMRAEKFIDANEALRIGLIDAIEEFDGDPETIKQDNYSDWWYYNQVGNAIKNSYQHNNNVEMAKPKSNFTSKLKALFTEFANVVNGIQNVVVTAADGTEIDFSEVETEAEIAVGDTATIAGASAAGEYAMPDGRTFVFESGSLTEIREAEAEAEAQKEPDAQQPEPENNAENEELKAEVQDLRNQLAKLNAEIEKGRKLNAKIEALLNNQDSKPVVVETTDPESKKFISFKKRN